MGIGTGFAGQLAAGINVVLVARRLDRFNAVGAALRRRDGVEFRAVGVDNIITATGSTMSSTGLRSPCSTKPRSHNTSDVMARR